MHRVLNEHKPGKGLVRQLHEKRKLDQKMLDRREKGLLQLCGVDTVLDGCLVVDLTSNRLVRRRCMISRHAMWSWIDRGWQGRSSKGDTLSLSFAHVIPCALITDSMSVNLVKHARVLESTTGMWHH
jgi:hypothetical protein